MAKMNESDVLALGHVDGTVDVEAEYSSAVYTIVSFETIKGLGQIITKKPVNYKCFQLTKTNLCQLAIGEITSDIDEFNDTVTLERLSRNKWLLDQRYQIVVRRGWFGLGSAKLVISLYREKSKRGHHNQIKAESGGIAAGGDISNCTVISHN